MGFSIDYGDPGYFGALLIALGVGAAIIVLTFLFRTIREAQDTVEEQTEPQDDL
jgi:hypothetical protein